MAIFQPDIHIHIHNHGSDSEQLNRIEAKINQLMPTIQELTTKVDALQTALDAEQTQIQNAINGLTETIQQLQVSGGTEAERQALADKLDAIKSDLEGTIPDAPTEPQP